MITSSADEATNTSQPALAGSILSAKQTVPFTAMNDHSRLDYALATAYWPIVLPDAISIHEHPGTLPYDALLVFGIHVLKYQDEWWGPMKTVHVYALDVEQEKPWAFSQTFRVHDQLNFSFLPLECREKNYFLPAVTLVPSQNKVVFYSFGLSQACSQVVVYDPSQRRVLLVNTLPGDLPPNLFVSLVATHLNEKADVESLVAFGGARCDQQKIQSCRNFSNALYVFTFTSRNLSAGHWRRLAVPGNTHTIPSERIAASLFRGPNSTLLMYGGSGQTKLSCLMDGMTQNCSRGERKTLKVQCDLWEFNLQTNRWQNISTLSADCKGRRSANCLASISGTSLDSIPARVAYSQTTNELSVAYIPIRSIFGNRACIGTKIVLWMFPVGVPGREWRSWQSSSKVLYSTLSRTTRPFLSLRLLSLNQHRYLLDPTELSISQISCPALGNCSQFALEALPQQRRVSQFPGNLGCISSPVVVRSRPFERDLLGDRVVLILGGSCSAQAEHDRGWEIASLAQWPVTPVWIYSPWPRSTFTMRLVQTGPEFRHRLGQTVSVLQNQQEEVAVPYGGMPLSEDNGLLTTWCFNAQHHYWMKANLTTNQQAPNVMGHPLSYHVAFTLPSGSDLAIYGGTVPAALTNKSPLRVLNDIFVLKFSDISMCKGHWLNLTSSVEGKPLPRLVGHTATNFLNKTFIFGGINWEESLFDVPDMLFTISVALLPQPRITWTPIKVSPPLPKMILASTAPYTKDMLLRFGGVGRICFWNHSGCSNRSTSFLVRLTENSDGSLQAKSIPFFHHWPMFSQAIINTTIFGGYSEPLSPQHSEEDFISSSLQCTWYLPGNQCPLGYGYLNSTCMPCQQGYYSSTTDGPCKPCGDHQLSRMPNRSTECFTPSLCYFLNKSNFCHRHGHCNIDASTKEIGCVCTEYGYMAFDQCRLPFKQILFGAAAVLALGLIGLGCEIWRRVRKSIQRARQNRLNLARAMRRLKELAKAIYIAWEDLKFIRQLGEGAYGKVSLAKRADMEVAVKMISKRCQHAHLHFLEQFIEEIEHMRTVRHANIVMFIGAGTQPQTNMPFIVMEYVARGSLFNLLRDASVSISHRDRLRFALDTAEGMKYLHGMAMPRLHCDLKSSNLLVTNDGGVKIGDFGMLRLVSTIGDVGRRPPEERLMANIAVQHPSNIPASRQHVLADFSSEMPQMEEGIEPNLTQVMGTSRWCSPETLCENIFSKQSDVYSYGVVLWEILTRELPYNNLENEDQVVREIKDGWRLPVPGCGPEEYEYRLLMERCWSSEPKLRPLFPEIARSFRQQLLESE